MITGTSSERFQRKSLKWTASYSCKTFYFLSFLIVNHVVGTQRQLSPLGNRIFDRICLLELIPYFSAFIVRNKCFSLLGWAHHLTLFCPNPHILSTVETIFIHTYLMFQNALPILPSLTLGTDHTSLDATRPYLLETSLHKSHISKVIFIPPARFQET